MTAAVIVCHFVRFSLCMENYSKTIIFTVQYYYSTTVIPTLTKSSIFCSIFLTTTRKKKEKKRLVTQVFPLELLYIFED